MLRRNRSNRRLKEENLPPEGEAVKPKFDDATEKLKYAVVIDSTEQAKRAIEDGANVNSLLYNDETLLKNAKSADVAKLLIQNGASLIFDKKGDENWYFVKTINFGNLDVYHELKDSGFLSEIAKNQSFNDKSSHHKDYYKPKPIEHELDKPEVPTQSITPENQEQPTVKKEQIAALLNPALTKKPTPRGM